MNELSFFILHIVVLISVGGAVMRLFRLDLSDDWSLLEVVAVVLSVMITAFVFIGVGKLLMGIGLLEVLLE